MMVRFRDYLLPYLPPGQWLHSFCGVRTTKLYAVGVASTVPAELLKAPVLRE